MTLTKKLLVVAVVFAASMTAAALIYKSRMPMQSDTASTANPTFLASGPKFAFTIHPQPRAVKEFMFVDGDLQAAKLANFRGKVVLLNLWATWCGPCRKEMPTLDRLQTKLGGPDFAVVALSIDQEGVAIVKDFYEELGLKALPIFVDESMTAPVALNALGVPTTLLISREGQEVGRYTGPAAWDSPEVKALISRYQQNGNADK